MDGREIGRILSGIVRIGTVMNIDAGKRRARVKFQSENETSGWLYVVQRFAAELYIAPDAKHTHAITDTYTGGGAASTFPEHDHLPGSHVTWWMPKINDTVLCLYLPVFNGDGFVLGGIIT